METQHLPELVKFDSPLSHSTTATLVLIMPALANPAEDPMKASEGASGSLVPSYVADFHGWEGKTHLKKLSQIRSTVLKLGLSADLSFISILWLSGGSLRVV